MAPCKPMLVNELRNITTVNLIANATSILEKIFWALIAIGGTLFIYDVMFIQLENWNENPTLVTTQSKKLSDIEVPSVTFCPKGLHKYGLVETLANFIDPEKKIPKEVLAVRNEYLKVQFMKLKERLDSTDFCEWLFGLENDERNDHPILRAIPSGQEEIYKSECLVRKSYLVQYQM